jgi:hypothetical protein
LNRARRTIVLLFVVHGDLDSQPEANHKRNVRAKDPELEDHGKLKVIEHSFSRSHNVARTYNGGFVFVVVARARRGRPESRKDGAFIVGLAILIGRGEAGGDVMAGDSVMAGSTCAEWPYGAAEWGEQRYSRPL